MTQDEIALKLDEAARKCKPIAQLAATENITLEEAYNIQRLSINKRIERGEKTTGFKLGFTSRAKMEQMGVHDLIWGILTDKMHIAPEEEVSLNQWIHPRAEPEIAFRLNQDITEAIGLSEIHNYIDKMAPAIEVIDSRYENFKFSLEDVVADNCSSTGYVIGNWIDVDTNISELNISLHIDGKTVETGKTSAILDNPLQSVVELTRLAQKAEVPLKKGDIVLAGAATAAVYLKENQHIEVQVEKMGNVAFRVK